MIAESLLGGQSENFDPFLAETYWELYQISKMGLFAEIVNSFQPITLFAKKFHPVYLTEF